MERHHFTPFNTTTPGIGRALLAWLVSLLGPAALAIDAGFQTPPTVSPWLIVLQLIAPWCSVVITADLAWNRPPRLGAAGRWRRPVGMVVEIAVAVAASLWLLGVPQAPGLLAVLVSVFMAVGFSGLLARVMKHPSLLLPLSFVALITFSTLLLKLPAATPEGEPIGWIDALFTSTSAVCVTGLAVRSTAEGFTPFGQAVILGAIQLGGLGFMIFGSTLALLFGVRPSYKESLTLSAALDEYPAHRILRFAWFIVGTTLAIEAAGAVVLYFLWPEPLTHGPGGRVWQAVFHSVSAFCNAGFDITGDSLVPVRYGLAPYLGIAPLIILGGLGFLVLEDATQYIRRRLRPKKDRPPPRLSTHTRVVLATTATLLTLGFVAVFVAQSAAAGGPTPGIIADATFMSVTSRTAGFNALPMDELSPGSRFTTLVLMAIGGSPGSTAGGIKTVAVAVLVLAVIATVRGRQDVEAFGRRLPDALVRKAATVAAGFFGVVVLATLTLDLTERIAFEPLLFEVVSAATTTGLSLGATGELSPVGRLVIVATMFLGRLGALSLLGALIQGAGVAGEHAITRSHLPRDTVSLG
ncbi:MAG: TrkH family potassium uptake protein [Phycisphaerales bacterium JB064]